MPKAIFFLFLLFYSASLFGQQKSLESYFSQVRVGKYPNLPAEVNKPENAATVLNSLAAYLHDSIAVVRTRAASITRLIGTRSKINTIRNKAVQQLTSAIKDADTGNAGAALTFLTEFKKNDFYFHIPNNSSLLREISTNSR